jgi:hypothetical protein
MTFFLTALPSIANAKGNYHDDEVKLSTTPIGSPFLRHYANDYKLDLYELVKFEKRGFGRTEIINLALISQKTGKPMKEYGKRRLNEKVTLKQLTEEAGMNYEEVYKKARDIKAGIEAKGDQNLPPPLFEKKEEKKDEKKDEKDDLKEEKKP